MTKSIQRLEREFGLVLFDRSRSHVAPTTVCDTVVACANAVLAGMHELDRTVQMLGGLETGSLAVGVGPAMSESYVTRAISSLAQEHPGIQVELRVDHWEQLSQWLIAGEIDLLVADLAGVADDNRFLITPLPAQEFIWFCRRGHPLSKRDKVSRKDLVQFPLATPRMPPWAVEWFHEVLDPGAQATQFVPLPTIRCESYSTLKRMVIESECVSVALAATIQSEVREGSLIALSVEGNRLKTNAGIVQLRNRTPSPLATAVVSKIERLA
jgi:DNA-binding transcriptional LysR family regulator